jgi:hypothetical protein
MLEPKNTLVGLAGQKAWHICAGEALPRISGKYFPSQLRTQKAGPELATAERGAGAGWGLRPKGSARKFVSVEARRCRDFCGPPKKKSSRFSAETAAGANIRGAAAIAAASVKRRRLREKGNS